MGVTIEHADHHVYCTSYSLFIVSHINKLTSIHTHVWSYFDNSL